MQMIMYTPLRSLATTLFAHQRGEGACTLLSCLPFTTCRARGVRLSTVVLYCRHCLHVTFLDTLWSVLSYLPTSMRPAYILSASCVQFISVHCFSFPCFVD